VQSKGREGEAFLSSSIAPGSQQQQQQIEGDTITQGTKSVARFLISTKFRGFFVCEMRAESGQGSRSDGRGWVAAVRSRGRDVRLGPSCFELGTVGLGRARRARTMREPKLEMEIRSRDVVCDKIRCGPA